MPFEFIQIPANGQGGAKEELNKLLRSGRIASVKKEFVSNGEDSFWAFCISAEQRDPLPRREPQQQHPDEPEQQYRVPHCPQLRPVGMDVPAESRGLNRPPSRSGLHGGSDKAHQGPPAASRPVDSGSEVAGGPPPLGGGGCLGSAETGCPLPSRC
jgi:hypothetical protein